MVVKPNSYRRLNRKRNNVFSPSKTGMDMSVMFFVVGGILFFLLYVTSR